MIAAQLNELGISSPQSQQQPEAPPRSNRPHSSSLAVKQVVPNSNPLETMDSTDSDSEPEESNDRARNDGTLLASDPPKPL